jgi:hypothetical protein
MTRRALDLLGTTRNDAYEAALEALREDMQVWWVSRSLSASLTSISYGLAALTFKKIGACRNWRACRNRLQKQTREETTWLSSMR